MRTLHRAKRLWALAVVAMCACSGEPTRSEGAGSIEGIVTAADGTTPIAAATVYLQSRGPGNDATTSNRQGAYTLTNVPAGQQVVVATKGAFRALTSVNVSASGATTAPVAKLAPTGKLGYVAGTYDSIEEIVRSLGYTAEALTETQLTSAAQTQPYKVIFLNCGAGIPDEAASNLKAWVAAGGTLYASDYEVDVVKAMFPTDLLTIGFGESETVTAAVSNPALELFVGKPTVSIAYNLGGWRTLSSLSQVPRVLLRGASGGPLNEPLAIEILHGQGKVIYTTFHNTAAITADQIAVLRFFIFS